MKRGFWLVAVPLFLAAAVDVARRVRVPQSAWPMPIPSM